MTDPEARVYAVGHYALIACAVLMIGTGCFLAIYNDLHPHPAFTLDPCYGPKGAKP
jgi:hypothetical protein